MSNNHSKRKNLTQKEINRFQDKIYSYYHNHSRILPWRQTDNPYHILISEIMLQQTQVTRVLKKYTEFISSFPDFNSLASAPLNKVLNKWQGLGYNRRAIALKKIAKIITTKYCGVLPHSPNMLMKLPGIGRYTASAIITFAFNQPTIFIETNIRTVFIFFFFPHKIGINDKELLPLIQITLDTENPREWYYALMDYGTMLKKTQKNPARKSAHYYKQTAFIGSNRQMRGQVLKLLTNNTEMSLDEITRNLRINSKNAHKKIYRILLQLKEEGFIKKSETKFRINE
jgi:A/G-specific adenine glycosylase